MKIACGIQNLLFFQIVPAKIPFNFLQSQSGLSVEKNFVYIVKNRELDLISVEQHEEVTVFC